MIQQVVLPDRYEGLVREANAGELSSIVVPVRAALERIDRMVARMEVRGRGAFVVLEGTSGIGKSTFLHTLKFFKEGVATVSVPGGASIRTWLEGHQPNQEAHLEILVLEEREAARSFTDRELEEWLHAVNGFIRSERGRRALVVWPANTDELRDRLVALAEKIGAESLLGTSAKRTWAFEGPAKDQYVEIGRRTLAGLNQSASFSDLGLTLERVEAIAGASKTVGGFLTRLQDEIATQEEEVSKLVDKEQCRLWIVAAAGNDPVADVAGLTRGTLAEIDTERLLSATGANIVHELRKQPQKLGLLGSVLNARILHLPVLTAAALVRAYADEPLRAKLRSVGFAVTPKDEAKALERLRASEIGVIFSAGTQGTLPRGPKLGSSSVESFAKLADIASTNDASLNSALGRGLVAAGMIKSFEVEQDFGSGMTRRTDILAQTDSGPVRIELMWRRQTSRAEIANYTLTKLANYGKAVGYLD